MTTIRPIEDRAQRGFTIIETLIVLAVAGFILLLIFEAIPTLQRNSRNNQRRQDVQTILADVSHYELNDSGKFPDDCGDTSQAACTQAGGSTPNDYFLRFTATKLSIYATNGYSGHDIILKTLSSDQTSPDYHASEGPVTDPNKVYIYNYQHCDTAGKSTVQGAGYSDVVALYAVENSSSTTQGAAQCQEL